MGTGMTWYEAIREICSRVNVDTTVGDVLFTAVKDGLITLKEAEELAELNDCLDLVCWTQLKRLVTVQSGHARSNG